MAGEIRIIQIPPGGFEHSSSPSPAGNFADSLIFISASNKTTSNKAKENTPNFLDYILASLGAKST